MVAVLKTVFALLDERGFESHPLRLKDGRRQIEDPRISGQDASGPVRDSHS